jgi:hypothetical protein
MLHQWGRLLITRLGRVPNRKNGNSPILAIRTVMREEKSNSVPAVGSSPLVRASLTKVLSR